MKTKLTYIINGLQRGGAEVGMGRLLSNLDPERFDITVVSLTGTSGEVRSLLPPHVEVIELNITHKHALHRLSPVWDVLGETDVLVCSLFHAKLIGTILGKLRRVPTIVVWQHNTKYQNRLRAWVAHSAHRVSDRVLADSQAVAEMLERDGIQEEKISVLPLAGIDTEFFSPTAGETSSDSNVHIGTLGRLVAQKGYPELNNCAEKLGSGYQFHVFGDGPRRSDFEANAPENVTYHGYIENQTLPERLSSCDIYFQPSRYEGLCITVIEAMACGLPVVASAVGGITESVVPEKTGFLTEPGDIKGFCTHLQKLGDSPELRSEFGETARERVIQHYSAEALAKAFLEALEKAESKSVW